MKANTSYNDFKGSVSADISDSLSKLSGDSLQSIGKYFELNEERFELVGLSITGTDDFNISLICIDKTKSKVNQECIVKMEFENTKSKGLLKLLFKNLNFVLYQQFDDKYSNLSFDKVLNFSDFH